jgi:hypothetical protein
MDSDFRSTKIAIFSLLALGATYVVALAYMLYLSFLIGALQNIIAILLWMSLVFWCAKSLYNKSNLARKSSIFIFGLHAFTSVFYIIFPPDFGSLHYLFLLLFLIVFAISIFGAVHALKAKKELMPELPEDDIT